MNRIFLLGMLFLPLAIFTGCDKDDPEPENQEELITTVQMTFVPTGGGDNIIMRWVDLDGDGGNAPEITGGTLADSSEYMVTLAFLDESSTPVEDITPEIVSEGEDHQIFFATTESLDLIGFRYEDMDLNNNPIGVETTFETGEASSGGLQVILRHEPNKNAAGVSNGDLTNAGGETDIEVQFDVTIQ